VVILPGGEIVAALDRNLIDAAEFNNTTSDRMLGFPDVRKVMMAQSYHQPMECLELLISKRSTSRCRKISRRSLSSGGGGIGRLHLEDDGPQLNGPHRDEGQAGVKVVKTPIVLEAQMKAWKGD